MTFGQLYVCATPIGHLADATFRLIETLKTVSCIAAEDTRKTRVLLDHYEIKTPMISLQKYNETQKTSQILTWLKEGQGIALVSDAGTPNVSDPGAFLIHAVQKAHLPIVPIPGPSAITTLLSASGILANHFYFAGFLSKKAAENIALFEACQKLKTPIVFFESAKRLMATLTLIQDHFQVAHVCCGKELTKRFETLVTGAIAEVLHQLDDIPIKGEWTLAIQFSAPSQDPDCHAILGVFKEAGLTRQQAIQVGKTLFSIPKNAIYRFYTS